MNKKKRSFLKWAGSKYRLVDEIVRYLPAKPLLIEPFVGAGSVFLNTHYHEYWLSDINKDLINLYNIVKLESERFIYDVSKLFHTDNNSPTMYYKLRDQFNTSHDPYQKALLFLYLNRHGYNGLCRYNLQGKFNVPFGSYQKPYFPEKELHWFITKAQQATFICEHYSQSLLRADVNSAVYCDPPYAPLSATSHFTNYYKCGFTFKDQAKLAQLAYKAMLEKGATVLISNHDTYQTRTWYCHAKLNMVKIRRMISCCGHNRTEVKELLALYQSIQKK